MIWIILGLALWVVPHSLKRLAPGFRANLGETPGKLVVTAASLAAIALMVVGYRSADPVVLWQLGDWARHLNNLIMVVAVVLLQAGTSKSRLRGLMRHPMLTALVLWAIAHLLVNGDLPSLVLFGGLGLWALASMAMINRAQPDHAPFAEGTVQGDIRLAVVSVVVFAVITGAHIWIGPNPFGG